ncbi:MAG: tetratricopeptide repeat protein, partial [Anaerolineales bacterium]
RACHYLTLAGEQAAAQFANELALDYFRRALDLTSPEQLEEQYRLLNARVNVLDMLGQRRAQQADLDRLLSLAEELADPLRLARITLKQAQLARAVGDYVAAGERAGKTLEFANQERLAEMEWAALFAESYRLWGEAARLQGDPQDANQYLQQALKLSQDNQYRIGEMKTLESLGTLAWSVGDYLEAYDFYARSVALARTLGDRRAEWSLLSNLGIIAKERGDPLRAGKYYAEALDIAREIGDRLGESRVMNNLGESQQNFGDYSAARSTLLEALVLAQDISDRPGEGNVLGNLCECARLLGDYSQAEDYAEQALVIFKATGFSMGQGIVLGNWAQIALAAGRARRAEELAQASLAIAREIGDRYGEALGLNSLGDALRALETLDESAAAYAQAEAIWQELADEAGRLHARLGRALVTAAGAGAGDHAGEILAAQPVEALLETSAGPEILLVDYVLGWQLLERLGDPRAAAVLDRAYQQLQARTDRISDPDDRQSFLENVPENRMISSQFASSVE